MLSLSISLACSITLFRVIHFFSPVIWALTYFWITFDYSNFNHFDVHIIDLDDFWWKCICEILFYSFLVKCTKNSHYYLLLLHYFVRKVTKSSNHYYLLTKTGYKINHEILCSKLTLYQFVAQGIRWTN